MILYFTGTGNSGYIARRIAEHTGESLCAIHEYIKSNQFFKNRKEGKLIFVLPTYAWRIPKVAEEWIRKSVFAREAKAYFVMNCGSSIGNTASYVRQLCKDKFFHYMGCGEIVMPENYIALFPAPDSKEALRIIKSANPMIDRVIARIKNDEPLLEKKTNLLDMFLSGVVNPFFYPAFVHAKKFLVKENCIGCHQCETVCMLNNIHLEEKKPVWGDKCTHCMACISSCPQNAIEYGKGTKKKARYRCPL